MYSRQKMKRFTLLLSALLLLSTWPITVSADKVHQILIVANTDYAPFQETINGFKKQLSPQLNITYRKLFLSRVEDKPAALSAAILEHQPDLIFALGTASTKLASHATSNIPIVSTMIMNNDWLDQMDNATGVSLGYPLTTQFEWIRNFFPRMKRIAILYNPEENEQVIQSARIIAPQTGFELLAVPVETPRQLPYALEQLENNIQIMLGIPDKVVFSPRTAQAVLLATFRNKVPLIGISDNWVESGALYALSWDYEDIGKQCATQSGKLLKGALIKQISIEYPRKVAYTINVKIAEHMNIEISDNLRKNAKHIFD